MLRFVTDFGDQAALQPSLLWLVVVLVVLGQRRAALAWVGVTVAAFGVIAGGKMLLAACGPMPHGMASPSGHTMTATLFYGGLARMLMARGVVGYAVAGLVAVWVGYTRVALGAHTVPEVIVGGIVGLVAVWPLRGWTADVRLKCAAWNWRQRVAFVGVLLLPAVLLHGSRSETEGWLQGFARRYVRGWLGCRVG